MATVGDVRALAAYLGRKKSKKQRLQAIAVKGRKEAAGDASGGKTFAAMAKALKMGQAKSPETRRRGQFLVKSVLTAKSAAAKERAARKAEAPV